VCLGKTSSHRERRESSRISVGSATQPIPLATQLAQESEITPRSPSDERLPRCGSAAEMSRECGVMRRTRDTR
jgi:hypothetical protein